VRVLVSGGAGFIGSNLVRALVARGADVVVADNLVATRSLRLVADVCPPARFVHVDIRSPEDLERLPDGPYDRVYHLAASFANALSLEQPDVDLKTNIDGTANVLAFARRAGCGLFVYTGSSSSYGDAPLPFTESGPMRPYTPYAMSKLAAEWHVRTARVPFAIFRLFNVYGPGDLPGQWRNAIPNMMAALDGGGPVRIFGREATRDFTYVDDVVEVLLSPERAAGQVVNLGTGREAAVVDVARRILRLFGAPDDRLSFEAPREWDCVVRRCADVTRLRALFGAAPGSDLGRGLAVTARWLHRVGEIRREVA
jgi:nucleoside-diphosphate-sugar epimerase